MRWTSPTSDPPLVLGYAVRTAAQQLLCEMRAHRLKIILIDAPWPRFRGHRVRAVESTNPAWYMRLYWSRARHSIHRANVERALVRLAEGRARGTAYEVRLLGVIEDEFGTEEAVWRHYQEL